MNVLMRENVRSMELQYTGHTHFYTNLEGLSVERIKCFGDVVCCGFLIEFNTKTSAVQAVMQVTKHCIDCTS